jgi:predicted RNase H-like HicB family nuclease
MQYTVIIEPKNGSWRALIPALANLSAEGASREEVLQNARQAAEAYLSQVECTTIEVHAPGEENLRLDSPQALLKALEAFVGDEEVLREHFEGIARERQQQREEVEDVRPGSPQSVLKAAGLFVGDEEAMSQHIEEIYAERRRQREEAERETQSLDAH